MLNKIALHVIGTDPPTQEGVPPGYVSVSLVDALNGPNKDNPGANMGMIVNSDDVTLTTNVSKSAAKKSRKQRRGSKEGSGKASAASTSGSAPGTSCCAPSSATGGPRQSSSTSSQLSQASISEEPEPATPVNLSENTSTKDMSSSMVNPKATKSAPETSVKVSLQIVNEVEQAQSATVRKPLNDESLDIVEEELAKMAVAESLTDLPLEISIGDADSTRITEIDEHDIDDDVDDDGDDGDDEDEIDDVDQEDEAVVITLPISTDTLGAKPQGGSLPGTVS